MRAYNDKLHMEIYNIFSQFLYNSDSLYSYLMLVILLVKIKYQRCTDFDVHFIFC